MASWKAREVNVESTDAATPAAPGRELEPPGPFGRPLADPHGGEPAADHHQECTVELVAGRGPSSTTEAAPASPAAVRPGFGRSRPGDPPGVSLRIEGNGAAGLFKFEGLAGATFSSTGCRSEDDRRQHGADHPGRRSDRLTLSETLRRRIPAEARPALKAMALNGGVVDLELGRFRFDPTAAPDSRLRYQAQASSARGCGSAPSCRSRSTTFGAGEPGRRRDDDQVTPRGPNGKTNPPCRRRNPGPERPAAGLMDLRVELTDLELDIGSANIRPRVR